MRSPHPVVPTAPSWYAWLFAGLLGGLLLTACADADPTVATSPPGATDGQAEPTEAAETGVAAEPSAVAEPSAAAEPSDTSAPGADGTDMASPADSSASAEVVIGVLGREDVEGGCMTLTVDGTTYELVAAPDSTVVIDSGNGVIASTGGEVVARAGESISVTGAVDEGMMTFCQIGPVLVVTDVTAA